MVAKLIYNLPEDNFDFNLATKSNDMWSALLEMRDFLKREKDISENNNQDARVDTIQSIQDYYFDILQEKELVNLIDS